MTCSLERLTGRRTTEKGDRVRFAKESVFLPDPQEVLAFASECDDLEGTIVDFSDSGIQVKAYAVVEVVRRLSLVVPVEQLRVVSDPGAECS